MINWKVRFNNEKFWLAFLPALGLLLSLLLDLFGIQYDFGDIVNKLIAVVKAAFALLAVLGVTNDPTTAGLGDSKRAMTYEEPWRDGQDNRA